ncbi:MAG: Rieske (2Fe-2S) protein [Nitriliruptorales bacterium]
MAFERVASLSDLEEGVGMPLQVEGHPICLVRLGDEVHAIYDVCSHQDYPLHEGFVFGSSIECALHGSTFDLHTGAAENLPATRPVPIFAVKRDGDEVFVDIEQQLNEAPIPEHF